MAKMRPSNAADYAEIVIERKRQPALTRVVTTWPRSFVLRLC